MILHVMILHYYKLTDVLLNVFVVGWPVVSCDDLVSSFVDPEMTRCWCGVTGLKDLLLLHVPDDTQAAMLLVLIV